MTRRPAPADTGQKISVLGALLQSARLDDRHSLGRVLFTFADIERLEDLPAQRLAERGGRRVTAIRVQANAALYAPGQEASLPALALLCFEEETVRGLAHLEELASRLSELKTRSPRDAGERAARAAILNNEEVAVPYRRVRLPSSFTAGRV